TGDTGPTGDTVPLATANSGNFYLNTTTSTVANGAPVLLGSTVSVNGTAISLSSPGEISLAANRTYLVNWTVTGFSSASNAGFAFGLDLNGVLVGGTQVNGQFSTIANALSGTAILPVSTASILRLINISTVSVTVNGGGSNTGKGSIITVVALT
ncbi:hypothetical protein COI63_33155, partial [Bacillus toyonensis]